MLMRGARDAQKGKQAKCLLSVYSQNEINFCCLTLANVCRKGITGSVNMRGKEEKERRSGKTASSTSARRDIQMT